MQKNGDNPPNERKNQMRKCKTTGQLSLEQTLQQNYLTGLIQCPLCFNEILDAKMCPNCCTIFCHNCIQDEMKSKHNECPSCRKGLSVSVLINCNLLMKPLLNLYQSKKLNNVENSEISLQLCSNKFSSPDLLRLNSNISINYIECQEHLLPLDYYCQTCSMGICSDCAVLNFQHKTHKVCRMSKQKSTFLQQIQKIREQILFLKKRFQEELQQAKNIIQNQLNFEDKKLQNLFIYFNRIKQNLCHNFDTNLDESQRIFEQCEQKDHKLNLIYQSIQNNLKKGIKCKVIRQSNQISNQLTNTLKYDLKSKQIKKKCSNIFIPEYEKKVFILDNYSYLKDKSDVLKSEPFFWKGIEWRLKIYPGGINKEINVIEPYLAMYLQMTKGLKGRVNKYTFKIELINQMNRQISVCKTCQSEFSEGMYSGFDQFAKIESLFEENYIHPEEDYLQIVLSVKSSTFYHAIQDQCYEIEAKQKLRDQKLQKIKKLRKQVGSQGFNVKKTDQNSSIVQAIIDEMQPKKNIKRIKSMEALHHNFFISY